MEADPVIFTQQMTRKQTAETINRVMERFPLILDILGQLGKSPIPASGDDDLRRGCERACTAILADLAKIPAAPVGKASKAEEVARSWLIGDASARLIDPTQLERMQQFIDSILDRARM